MRPSGSLVTSASVVSQTNSKILGLLCANRLAVLFRRSADFITMRTRNGNSSIYLPEDIKQLYKWRNGSRPMTNRVEDFFPLYRFVPLDEACAEKTGVAKQVQSVSIIQRTGYSLFAGHHDSWLCIFSDGSGNGYFYDHKRKQAEGLVFYNYADEADYMFFPSMKNVLAGVARCYETGAFKAKATNAVFELEENYEAASKIWGEFGAGRP